MKRMVLVLTFLGFSWLAMQVVHEAGHVVAAIAGGGRVERVVLHPLAFSRTDVAYNSSPLRVVWAGPVMGVVMPLLVLLLARKRRWRCGVLFQFFAGFCLIANGVYIGAGAWMGGNADPHVMLAHGSPAWVLVGFGALAGLAGLFLWHRLGAGFGLGGMAEEEVTRAMTVSAGLLVGLVVLELVWSWGGMV